MRLGSCNRWNRWTSQVTSSRERYRLACRTYHIWATWTCHTKSIGKNTLRITTWQPLPTTSRYVIVATMVFAGLLQKKKEIARGVLWKVTARAVTTEPHIYQSQCSSTLGSGQDLLLVSGWCFASCFSRKHGGLHISSILTRYMNTISVFIVVTWAVIFARKTTAQ